MAEQIGVVGEIAVDLFCGPKLEDGGDRRIIQLEGKDGIVKLSFVELLEVTALVMQALARK